MQKGILEEEVKKVQVAISGNDVQGEIRIPSNRIFPYLKMVREMVKNEIFKLELITDSMEEYGFKAVDHPRHKDFLFNNGKLGDYLDLLEDLELSNIRIQGM